MKNLNRQFLKLDASESVFFNRQLEHVKAKAFEVKYEALKGFMFVPVNTEVSPAKETFTYRVWDAVGMAKLIKSYAKDFPRADVFAREVTSRIKSFGASYGYNVQEIRAAASENVPLEQRRANAAKKAIDQFHENTIRTGITEVGITGFLNITGALDASGVLGAEPWTAADDSDDILDDLHAVANYMPEQTSDVEHGDTMLLPLTTYNLISTKRMGAGDGAMTILKAFLENNRYVKRVEPWTALETAGAASAKRGVVYRKDPEVIEYIAPVIFEQFPAQEEGMEFVVPCHGRSGGVACYFPKAVCYFDGI